MTKGETKKLFLDSLKHGYDIEFTYNDIDYGVVRPGSQWFFLLLISLILQLNVIVMKIVIP